MKQAQPELFRLYVLRGGRYAQTRERWLPNVGLGLTMWEGAHEGKQDVWLRWRDENGNVIPAGVELVEQERQHAAQERQRAEPAARQAELAEQRAAQAEQQAAQERQRAERLAAQLRALGVEP